MIPGDNRKISKVPSTAGLTVVEKRTLDLREGGRARVPSRPPFDTAKRFRDCALSACASLSRFHFALFAATLHLLSRKASRIDPVEGDRRAPPSPSLLAFPLLHGDIEPRYHLLFFRSTTWFSLLRSRFTYTLVAQVKRKRERKRRFRVINYPLYMLINRV